jgi:hypothetical protein
MSAACEQEEERFPVFHFEGPMEALFSNKDAGMILVFVAAGLTVVGCFIAHYWYKTRREEIRAGLKQSMLDRGMSAYEIRTVIEAGSDPAGEEQLAEKLKTQKQAH